MKKLILPIFAIITVISFNSCEKVDTPQENAVIEAGARRIIIEEFTGHYCSNCPQGAAEIERLVNVYGDQIIPISLHAGDQTFNEPHIDPVTGAPIHIIGTDTLYSTDFRTTDGNTYASTFDPFGLPSGIVSRQNGATATAVSQWESEILAIKDIPQIADIEITIVYDSLTRIVTADIETNWLTNAVSGNNYKLQVYLIEDHVIDWQLDGTTDVPNYEHNHVFRGAVNTTWGESITATTQGTSTTETYSYTLNSEWNEDNCEVVAFIYKESPSYEVMQANIQHVTDH
ncbi:MAG: hypothetical protein COB15_03605 [Flavobacteriales bacterium]|nr:MAG: hypothetical protein COB15_03605 [Flavobacteriales bacterium]